MDLLKSGKRLDNRGFLDYRPITLKKGVIGKAEGSAMVSLGNTKVLVGVKVETGTPYSDTPNLGVLTVNAELLPLAHEIFEPGPPDENSIELARVVDRGIRESKSIDLEKLILVPGKLAYVVFVDVYILNHDGNLVDASALAAVAALLDTKIPEVIVEENGEVRKTENYKPLPIQECPLPVTIAKIGENLLVDPTLEEETISSAKITITTMRNGGVCAIQKSGTGVFTLDEIVEAYRIAKEKAAEMRKLICEGG